MEKSDNYYYLIIVQKTNSKLVYNVVFDTAICSLEKRFNIYSKFMADLHPSIFEKVQYLSAEPLERLSSYLKKFDPSMTALELCSQLKDFARKWDVCHSMMNT